MSAQKKNNEDPVPKQQIFEERLFSEDEDPATFKNQLIALADSYGEQEHYKPFTEEEKDRFRARNTDLDIELNKLTKEKKAFVKTIDATMKPMKVEKATLVDNLESGHVWTTETLYSIVDPDTRMIGVYDEKGILQRTEQMKRGRGLQKTIQLPVKDNNDE